jgi:hypothetical protein
MTKPFFKSKDLSARIERWLSDNSHLAQDNTIPRLCAIASQDLGAYVSYHRMNVAVTKLEVPVLRNQCNKTRSKPAPKKPSPGDSQFAVLLTEVRALRQEVQALTEILSTPSKPPIHSRWLGLQ